MTKECTLKEAYIAKCLDEFQPDWRRGRDVTYETKMKIQKRLVSEHLQMELTSKYLQDIEKLKGI